MSAPRTLPAAPPAPATLPALLAHRAAAHGERTAIVNGERRLGFADWQRRSGTLAAVLRAAGLATGDRVGLCYGTGGWTEFAVAFLAVLRAGGVAVPFSDRTPPAGVGHLLADSGARFLLHGPAGAPAGVPAGVQTLTEGTDSGPDGPDPDLPDPEPSAPAQILYTSGTTGTPKGVTASHANLAHGCTLDERRRPLRHSAAFLHTFPVGTNAGQTMLVNALNAHARCVAAPQFTPARFLRLIPEHEVGSVFLVPATAIEILASPALAAAAGSGALDGVRLVGSTAAALPQPVALGLSRAFAKAQIVNYYTSTEAAPAQVTLLFDPARPQSPGRPASLADLRVTDGAGRPVPPGEAGELWLRSPSAPRGYLGERDEETFRGRWTRMGDLGRVDEDGFLHLLDRERDVVKSGAHKVSTLQVEDALHAHPLVADAAAVGVPHPVLGSVVAAFVVPAGELTPAALRTFLLDRLAVHELPATVHFRDALPRNEAGKVLKRELRRTLDPDTPEAAP
ncbi:class I adenylate-forming enzyme family protein [Kitasatospora cineracea]|uniref:Acyl-CoA synthetase (AMP-forming)/AMP-acid ligase II n=1 Tax=Kitasatospora cineracea TaxID=88074 RepID=A0A8G1XDQ0_9ACTN|nr:class I adenylate-forming enzyme family protein [Kitasatospora cineracea]ROR46084.1 acyl-CoA synthetase (AMP-forming)/AMP-acid ligase II [Kitasatospora cineracea]